MEQAEQYGIQRDHSEISEQPVSVVINAEEVKHLSELPLCSNCRSVIPPQ